MNITYLELTTNDLHMQWEYYSKVLELPVRMFENCLQVITRSTEILFVKADADFEGAYHFAFNIPENQFRKTKKWMSSRTPLLTDAEGKDEFHFDNWNSKSIYFKDAAGNVLEFIARHNLKNAAKGDFNSSQILNVSEIGLPSENVIEFANKLCSQLDVSVFKQEPNEEFMPVGDDNGLFIIPIKDRIWIPNSGVPAKLLPVKVRVDVDGKQWQVHGMPYEIDLMG